MAVFAFVNKLVKRPATVLLSLHTGLDMIENCIHFVITVLVDFSVFYLSCTTSVTPQLIFLQINK